MNCKERIKFVNFILSVLMAGGLIAQGATFVVMVASGKADVPLQWAFAGWTVAIAIAKIVNMVAHMDTLKGEAMSQQRSGRTTRMIEKANKLLAEGNKVRIIVAEQMKGDVIRRLNSPNAIVMSPYPVFDWQYRCVPGSSFIVLVDHFIAEQKQQEIVGEIERLHRTLRVVNLIAHEFDE